MCLVARIYNLTKFARFHKPQSDNMCKVYHQTLSYVEVLSETQLYWYHDSWLSLVYLYLNDKKSSQSENNEKEHRLDRETP